MSFQAGDYLIFQVESGYGLLRVLDVSSSENGENIWHLATYNELFPDIEFAEAAIPEGLTIGIPHVALTTRAFESTQVSKMANRTLNENESAALDAWRKAPHKDVSDRSIRLIMGLR